MKKILILRYAILVIFITSFFDSVTAQKCDCASLTHTYKNILVKYNEHSFSYPPVKAVTHYSNGKKSKIEINNLIRYINKCTGLKPTNADEDSTFYADSIFVNSFRNWLVNNKCNKKRINVPYLIYQKDTVNRLDSLNRKQGVWLIFKNKKPYIKGYFKDNEREGEFIKYYPNGNIASSARYENDIIDELSPKDFFKDKTLATEIKPDTVDGGLMQLIYNRQGKLILKFHIYGSHINEFNSFYSIGDILSNIPYNNKINTP